MTVRPLSSACGHGTEMLLILTKLFSTWLCPDIFRYDSLKKCPTILYGVNLWLKSTFAGYKVCTKQTEKSWSNVVLWLGQRLRHWPSIKTTLGARHVFAGGGGRQSSWVYHGHPASRDAADTWESSRTNCQKYLSSQHMTDVNLEWAHMTFNAFCDVYVLSVGCVHTTNCQEYLS